VTRRRLRRKLPWIPPAEDDELQRQLDLFVWAKAYQQSMRGAKQGFVWELMQLPQEPSILDYEDMRQFCRAREIWESRFQRVVPEYSQHPQRASIPVSMRPPICMKSQTARVTNLSVVAFAAGVSDQPGAPSTAWVQTIRCRRDRRGLPGSKSG
jgi:hypothetical protein